MMLEFLRPSARGPFKLANALLLLAVLAGCGGPLEDMAAEKTGTVTAGTLALMQEDNMERSAPILVRIFREESTLEVWKQDRTGRFRPLRSYRICRFSGGLGPKKAFGDHQAPEGFYDVGPAQMNPHSREYLAFNIGYPNAYDRALGRTGDSLMVHGGCRSVGCYAMTDQQIDEIFGLAYEAFRGGQYRIQVQAYPFRMTDANLMRHMGDPNYDFWQMLKAGSDLFAETGLPPRVAVCDQRYTFTPASLDGARPVARSCPTQFSGTTAQAL